MKFNDINPAVDLDEHEVRVRLFGPLELENRHGRVVEHRTKPWEFTWITLKYLLANAEREVDQDELLALEWAGKRPEVNDIALRVRRRRVRDLLDPLELGGIHGLMLFSQNKFRINPDFKLITDESVFNMLTQRVLRMPVTAKRGLDCCIEALELCRGPYLEYTEDKNWVGPFQEHYRKKFCELAENTLQRMSELDNNDATELLWRRAISVVPEEQELHKKIMRFMIEQQQDLEVMRYISQLTYKGARWLEE